MPPVPRFTVLHYTGYDEDPGGIVAVIANLAATGRMDCVLGVNPGCVQRRPDPLPAMELPRVRPETIGLVDAVRARAVARAVQPWLRAAPHRVFHGHTRAGLLVAGWLHAWGERRVVASVHCYGRHRWFYRWAARRLGPRLFWLSPAMRAHYGLPDAGWTQCMPECVLPSAVERIPAEPGRLRLAGVGGILRWKRWDLVVAALGRLTAEERRRIRFVHVGTGDASGLAALRRQVAAAGLDDVVEFRGQVPTTAPLLAASDALVVASDREPFSVALLEALAAGVPVIGADSGGTPDIVRDGVNGILFRSGDAGALAAGLRRWLEAPPAFDPDAIRRTAHYAGDVAERWVAQYAGIAAVPLSR